MAALRAICIPANTKEAVLSLQFHVRAFISQLLVEPSTLNQLHVNIVKDWGQIMAGMWSLLECDSLSWSVVDFRHWCEHCPATQQQSAAHTGMLDLSGDNAGWQRRLSPSRSSMLGSVGARHPATSTFSNTASALFLFDPGQWEWCLSSPTGVVTCSSYDAFPIHF